MQIYTALPILLLGVFDQDVSDKTALAFPYLYIDGLLGKRLNLRVFGGWFTCAVWEALVMLFVPYFALTVADHPVGGTGGCVCVCVCVLAPVLFARVFCLAWCPHRRFVHHI